MLIEFRIANFRSIHEAQVFSLVASKDAKLPNNLIPQEKFNLLKAAAIYGANASGKSNLIKALEVMQAFVINSATRMNDGDEIPGVVPFRLSKESQQAPSLFEVSLMLDNTRYIYGFTATRQRVHDEWLTAIPSAGRAQTWFERRFDPVTSETNWTFRGPLARDRQLLIARTRDNALALSTASRENVKELQVLFHWFLRNLWVFDLSSSPDTLMQRTAERCHTNEHFRERVLRSMQDADLSINGLAIENMLDDLPTTELDMSGKITRKLPLSDYMKIRANKMLHWKIATLHRKIDSDEYEQFDFEEDELNGTQRFFAIIGPFLDAIDKSATLVIDELECSMHPKLTRSLVELFQSPHANTTGAQLIFATHDTVLLDQTIFRRDQLWLVEKYSGASEFFSLYDINEKDRPRNTESLQRNYLAGRYGGIPLLGATFEDLEIK